MSSILTLALFLGLFVDLGSELQAQNKTPFFQRSDTLNKKRRTAVYVTEAALGTAALIGLNELWYSQYPRSSFKSLNDNSQWMQMDKFGHIFSSYYIGKMGMDALAWAGETKKNQLIYGATLGFVFLTTIEVLDGFSEEWGFSTGDAMANALGTGLLVGQELLWDEQQREDPQGDVQYRYETYNATVKATSDELTLFIRGWKKWADGVEGNYDLDCLSLVGPHVPGTQPPPSGQPTATPEPEMPETGNEFAFLENPVVVVASAALLVVLAGGAVWSLTRRRT